MLSWRDRFALRLAFNQIRPPRSYEPIEIGGRRLEGKRDSVARWEAISKVLASSGAKSMLDVGCSEGWFLRRAAEDHGCIALGIDSSDRRVAAGELARLHDGIANVAVMAGSVNVEMIPHLPVFDVVLCLSVVHHIVREKGMDGAERFMSALSRRARKALIFEMGTSEERDLGWTHVLPAMEEGQESFVRAFLERCGLKNIRVIGDTESLKKDARRLLFVGARPDEDKAQ